MSDSTTLANIERTLDDLKALFILLNEEKLEVVKKSLLKEGSVKLQVYNLCDGTKTTKQIADAIQKSTDYVSSYLSILRREGLIRTVEKDGVQVHEQVF